VYLCEAELSRYPATKPKYRNSLGVALDMKVQLSIILNFQRLSEKKKHYHSYEYINARSKQT
jgi:hypothetical protein